MNIESNTPWYETEKNNLKKQYETGEIDLEQYNWKMDWLDGDLAEEQEYRNLGLIK